MLDLFLLSMNLRAVLILKLVFIYNSKISNDLKTQYNFVIFCLIDFMHVKIYIFLLFINRLLSASIWIKIECSFNILLCALLCKLIHIEREFAEYQAASVMLRFLHLSSHKYTPIFK